MNTFIPRDYLNYFGEETKEEDFDAFWREKIDEVFQKRVNYTLELCSNYNYKKKKVYRIEMEALDGTNIVGWYICSETPQKYCMLTSHGYRSAKKRPHEYLYWVDSGVDILVFDLRLQGGETGSVTPIEGPLTEIISSNILTINNSYLMLIYQDMMLASKLPFLLGYKGYILEGTSQAGGLAIAIGGLMGTAKAIMANVPSNSDIDQRIKNSSGSFKAFQKICNFDDGIYKRVLKNVSYFDTKNIAEKIDTPVFVSVGGLDTVCPPKAFYATYNRILSTKELIYYPFSGHEGGGDCHVEKEINFLQSILV